MLAREARGSGAGYVGTYRPTVGYDVCAPAS